MPVNAGTTSVVKFDEILPTTNYSKRILFIGTKESSGTAGNFELKENISSLNSVNTYFGSSSHIAQGLRYAVLFNENRAAGEDSLFLDAIGINPVGVKATATVTFSGTTASETTTCLFSATKEYEKKTFNIAKGDTPSLVAASLKTVINNDVTLPFVASINPLQPSVLTLTATCEGSFLNYVKLLVENLPTGITNVITDFANGSYTGISDLTNLKNEIANRKFDFFVIEKDLFEIDSSLKSFFDNRMNSIQNIDKQGIVGMTQVSSNIDSFVNNYATNQFAFIIAQKETYTLPYITLAAEITKIAGSLVRNYMVGDYMVSVDGLGGPRHANRAINKIKLDTVLKLKTNFADEDLKTLKVRGYTTIENNETNQFAIITGNQSTYILNSQGFIPPLNRMNDIIRKAICAQVSFYAVMPLLDKVVKLGSKENPDYDILPSEIESICNSVILTLQSRDANDVIYGYLQNGIEATLAAKARIANAINRNLFNSRTINLNMLQEIAKSIENIILSIGFR